MAVDAVIGNRWLEIEADIYQEFLKGMEMDGRSGGRGKEDFGETCGN